MNFQDFHLSDAIAPNGRRICDNFSRFFKGSVTTTKDGAPLRLFHGTWKDFDRFSNPYAGKAWEMFSDSADYSAQFAVGNGGHIIPVFVSMRRPLDLRTLAPERGDVRNKLLALLRRAGVNTSQLVVSLPYERDLFQVVNIGGHCSSLAEDVKAAGYDGIIMPEQLGDIRATTYIALNSTQIKSAIGNSGDFDPDSGSLTDSAIKRGLGLDLGMLALAAVRSARATGLSKCD